MTYEEYVKAVYNDRPRDQRIGQWAFNLCVQENPRIADRMFENPDLDPFYEDKNLQAFLSYAGEQKWDA